MIHPVEEAQRAVLSLVAPLPAEEVPLRSATGRVLARNVRSAIAIPPWDNASMDGYALRARDIEGATDDSPIELPVHGTVAAGGAKAVLAEGGALRIMTGAPMPRGADTVVRVEDTDRGTGIVRIHSTRDANRNIRSRGEDVLPGTRVAERGSVITGAILGVLASVGVARPMVVKRPRVALLSTGDEVVEVDRFDEVRAGRRIVSSNSYSLAAAIESTGAVLEDLGIAPDDPDEIAARFVAASGCDLLVTTGGVSAGEFDYTRDVVRRLGGEIAVARVRMRPGAPLGVGSVVGVPWIGLPGNPVSTLVTFEVFARPAIRRLRGERAIFPREVPVVVTEDITLAAPLTHFLRATLAVGDDGVLRASLTGAQGSGMLTSMARADALLVVPHDRMTVAAGELVGAYLLGDRPFLVAGP